MQTDCIKKTKENARILSEWLKNNLTLANYNEIVGEMVAGCMVTKSTFRNWTYGRCRIPALAMVKLNEISMKYNNTRIFGDAEVGSNHNKND